MEDFYVNSWHEFAEDVLYVALLMILSGFEFYLDFAGQFYRDNIIGAIATELVHKFSLIRVSVITLKNEDQVFLNVLFLLEIRETTDYNIFI